MLDERLEFAISQYADGSLPASERAALESLLEDDAAAREALADEHALDRAFESLEPLPSVDWDRLARHLSREAGDRDAVVYLHERRRLQIPAMRWIRPLAAAAIIAVVVGLVWRVRPGGAVHREGGGHGPTVAAGPAVTDIQGPSQEVAAGAPVQQIDIGPGPDVRGDATYGLSNDVVVRPSRVVIATDGEPAQDTTASPY